jgi:hypothetical protein
MRQAASYSSEDGAVETAAESTSYKNSVAAAGIVRQPRPHGCGTLLSCYANFSSGLGTA